jgi:hypothetical protein
MGDIVARLFRVLLNGLTFLIKYGVRLARHLGGQVATEGGSGAGSDSLSLTDNTGTGGGVGRCGRFELIVGWFRN